MADKIILTVIKTSRGGYIERVSILPDRDRKVFPFVLAYETVNKAEALKFESGDAALALIDLLNDTKDESFFPEDLEIAFYH